MMTPTAVELAAWLEDALDPDRTEEIARMVAVSPKLQARVGVMRTRLNAEGVVASPWCIPMPGLKLPGAPRAELRDASVMGGLGPGARFEIVMEEPPEPWRVRLVVLTRSEHDWEVIFPVDVEDDVPVAELPLAETGGRLIGLVAGPTPGRQRWALLYMDREPPLDWQAPPKQRWESVQRALECGLSPVVIERVVALRR